LEQSIIDMQEGVVQLRQAVTRSIAAQKRTQQQYNQAQTEANKLAKPRPVGCAKRR
jgi:phage shock protein A